MGAGNTPNYGVEELFFGILYLYIKDQFSQCFHAKTSQVIKILVIKYVACKIEYILPISKDVA